jgi:hypothetical protein
VALAELTVFNPVSKLPKAAAALAIEEMAAAV